MAAQRTREKTQTCFTPREPDPSVRRWGAALTRSGRRSVLDVGCGGGRHVIYLLRLGMSVTAGDLFIEALEETRSWLVRERLHANLVQLDMMSLPFPNESFDAVLSVNVLHHAQPREARAAVREAWRVLRPGGIFLAVLAGPGDCHCLMERPAIEAAHPFRPPCDDHGLHGLFSGFRIMETQRRRFKSSEGQSQSWQGVNWRVWAERPVAP